MGKEYDFKSFFAKESPFHDEYVKPKGNSPTLADVRVNGNLKKDLKKHFEGIYDKGAMTKGINQILQDYMDRVCLQRRTFNHLEVMMLIPKTDDIDELVNKSKIISFINTKTDFNEYYQHKAFDGEYNLVYELKPFDELNFPLNIIRETKGQCVIKTPKEDCDSFEAFKQRQKELYDDIDLDDCYFVRFPLNNYLDSFENGEYHHDSFKKDHMGIYVFQDPYVKINKGKDYERKIFFVIDWHYLSDISKIEFDFGFGEIDGIINWINRYRHEDEEDYADLIQALNYAFSDDFSQMKMANAEKDYLRKLKILRSLQMALDDVSDD